MSKYSDILKDYIEKSNLSLSEIEKGLRKKGFNKNKSYLSNLQNGKVEPPSTDVNIAIAEIIGADPLRLILTPLIEHLKQNKESGVTANSFIKEVSNLMFSLISTLVDIYKEEFYEYAITLVDDEGLEEDFKEDFKETLKVDINYENMRKVYDEIPEEEIIKMFLPLETDKIKIGGETEELQLEVTSDEEQYLIECLQIYRKLQLKPKNLN
jgi:transcriptional regulator with XRE-family HTH domain